jgi:NTE family protein
MNKKIGIVLSGGGAKGAFEIGVLKVLLEKIKTDGDVLHSVAGTSIGALNGAFVVANQFSDLERIWLSWNNNNCPLVQTEWYGNWVSMLIRGYMYNTEPVRDFFVKNLSVDNIFNSPIKYINTMVRLGDGEPKLGGNLSQTNNYDLVIREIMASMAFIPGTESVTIDGQEYVDGGFRDTIPVKALIENSEKLDKIYIINVNTQNRMWNNKIQKNSNSSLLGRFSFAYDEIIWDETNRSDIEIGRLKFWNSDAYKVIYPEFVKLSTANFDSDLIKESYLHGIEVANKIKD